MDEAVDQYQDEIQLKENLFIDIVKRTHLFEDVQHSDRTADLLDMSDSIGKLNSGDYVSIQLKTFTDYGPKKDYYRSRIISAN